MTDWPAIIIGLLSLLAAVGSAIAAWKACVIARTAFDWQKRQAGPHVSVTARTDQRTPTIIYLVIENTGRATAYDIRFSLSRDLPKSAFFLTVEGAEKGTVQTMTDGPLISGIPALASGDSRVFMWGQYGGLYHFLGDSFVKVIASCRDEQKQDFESTSVLEVKSFVGTDASDNDPLSAIAKHTKRMSDALHGASNGMSPLIVETPAARKERVNAEVAAYKQRRQGQNANDA